MNIILWMFLMVPTQKCLDAYDVAHPPTPSSSTFLMFSLRPSPIQFVGAWKEGEVPPVMLGDGTNKGCYEMFASSVPFKAVPWAPPGKDK